MPNTVYKVLEISDEDAEKLYEEVVNQITNNEKTVALQNLVKKYKSDMNKLIYVVYCLGYLSAKLE